MSPATLTGHILLSTSASEDSLDSLFIFLDSHDDKAIERVKELLLSSSVSASLFPLLHLGSPLGNRTLHYLACRASGVTSYTQRLEPSAEMNSPTTSNLTDNPSNSKEQGFMFVSLHVND